MVTVVTSPVEEPVTLAEMMEHLRVDQGEEDTLIDSLIMAAREHAELISRRAFITQVLALHLDAWPDGAALSLPRPPLQSVTSVVYVDADGDTQTLAASSYQVQAERERIVLASGASWPTIQADSIITVTYVAGYGDKPENVPARYGQAIRLLVAQWFEHREAASDLKLIEMPTAVETLLMTDRAY